MTGTATRRQDTTGPCGKCTESQQGQAGRAGAGGQSRFPRPFTDKDPDPHSWASRQPGPDTLPTRGSTAGPRRRRAAGPDPAPAPGRPACGAACGPSPRAAGRAGQPRRGHASSARLPERLCGPRAGGASVLGLRHRPARPPAAHRPDLRESLRERSTGRRSSTSHGPRRPAGLRSGHQEVPGDVAAGPPGRTHL